MRDVQRNFTIYPTILMFNRNCILWTYMKRGVARPAGGVRGTTPRRGPGAEPLAGGEGAEPCRKVVLKIVLLHGWISI